MRSFDNHIKMGVGKTITRDLDGDIRHFLLKALFTSTCQVSTKEPFIN
jgi:hypothetical protein